MAEYVPNRVPCSKKPAPTPPQPEPLPPVTLCDLTGVKYFKLQSDIPGDYTKNCGLLGNEIDENFYFLRSMDIKTAYTIDEEGRKILVLERVNCGRDIKIDITQEQDEPVPYKFWEQDGHIWITFPDGQTYDLRDENGHPVTFLIAGYNVHIATDSSIEGDGSFKNPVSLDLAYRTGTYMPADFFADLSCSGADITMLPPIGNGHAVVTKENLGRFGRLYTFDEAEKIAKALEKEGRGWRLPTKEDWGRLLNWAEEKDENRNHITDQSGNFGCVAGARLRSTEYWKESPQVGRDDFGFTVFPVGVCPEVNNTAEPSQFGFEKLYEVSTFWTSSIAPTGEIYVRTFSYGHDDVAQFTEARKKRFSIRLVRDIYDDFDIPSQELILGDYLPIVPTTDGTQLWTSINVSIVGYEDYDPRGVTVPEAWKDVKTELTATAYYRRNRAAEPVDIDGRQYADFLKTELEDIPSSIDIVDADDWDHVVAEDDVEPFEEVFVKCDTAGDTEAISLTYTIHMDMATETRFFYNAWDGNKWHKKLMREGESVVLLNEDFILDEPCDTAATPYVTSANTNHEWRIYVNEQTGLDELRDVASEIAGEFERELETIREAISSITENITNLSGFVGDMYDEMQSGFSSAFTAIADLQDELDRAEEAVGLDNDGNYIAPESGLTSGSTSVMNAIEILDNAVMDNQDDIQVLSGIVEELVSKSDDLQEEVDNIENGVGLDEDGNFIPNSGTTYLDDAETVQDEILILDGVVASAMTEIEELKKKTIEPLDESIIIEVSGNTTYVGVNIDPEDKHIKLGENGLWFDGDFGLI